MESNSKFKKPKNRRKDDLIIGDRFPEEDLSAVTGQNVETEPYIEETERDFSLRSEEVFEAEFEEIPDETVSLFQRDDQIEKEPVDDDDSIKEEEEKEKDTPYPTHSFEEGANPDIERLRRKKPLKNKVLFNIFAICLLLAIALVLILKVLSSGGDTEEALPVPQTEFESGEEVSVEKAKTIIEEANKELDVILPTSEATDSPAGTVTTLPALPEEEEPVVVDGKIEYINDAQNIHFTYPSEWLELLSFTAKKRPENVKNVVMVGRSADSGVVDNMRISIEGTPKSITSKHYFEKTEGLMQQVFPKFQLISTDELTVSGREAPSRVYTWTPEAELERTPFAQEQIALKQQQIYVAGKEKVYVITFTATAKEFDDQYPKYKEILSTLELDN